jgi:GT2 family glycosyltransferase
MFPKVSIIILNWNGKEDTIECLESLKKITYSNYEILLVDNGSTDGSVEWFKKLYPTIKIIENDKNLGFAEGNNVGIEYALKSHFDYVLLLNNDTTVSPDFLDKMIPVIESERNIGIVGPKIMNYFNPEIVQSYGVKVNLWTVSSHNLQLNDIRIDEKYINVDYVQGCAILIKRDVIDQIGLLDKKYFLYGEEKDLCFRARESGFYIACIPSATIWHKESVSSKKVSGLKIYFMERNRFLFINKFGSSQQKLFYTIYTIFRIPIQFYMIVIRRGDLKSFHCYLKSLIDGYKFIM